MALKRIFNLGGVNTYVNPLLKRDGDFLYAINVDSQPYGAKIKRSGYITFLGTADGSAPTTLFSWTKNDGTSLFVYRASGSSLYYSVQGTGAWTLCGNGTISAGGHVGYAVLDDTLIIGDGVGSTRHTTNGTSFTDTTLAPVAEHFAQFQNKIYAGGTSSTLFYSTTGTASNWDTSISSSSLTIPGPGKINMVRNINDRIVTSKNSGVMHRWDGYNLVDTSTKLGPSSPYSVGEAEGYHFWLNRLGIFGYGGDKPQLLSNAIQRQIYNDAGSAIVGSTFNTAPGVVHRYNYYTAVGTATDDFTGKTIDNAIIKYDYQKNEFLDYTFANFPTAWHSFKDVDGIDQLIFGVSSGQCYKYGGTATSDSGSAIESSMLLAVHLGDPEKEKKWYQLWAFFNPGCAAKIQIAVGDTYQNEFQNWQEIGNASSGILNVRFFQGTRGRLLFMKIYEASKDARFSFYGAVVDAEEIPVR